MAKLIIENDYDVQDYQLSMHPDRVLRLKAHNGQHHEFRDGDTFTRLSNSTMRYRDRHVFMDSDLIDHLVSNSKKD